MPLSSLLEFEMNILLKSFLINIKIGKLLPIIIFELNKNVDSDRKLDWFDFITFIFSLTKYLTMLEEKVKLIWIFFI